MTLPMHGTEVGVIVAHPDDETLWAGGTLLSHPDWHCHIYSLCRVSDADRAPRFFHALGALGASGGMLNLDDGPDQTPLSRNLVERAVLAMVESLAFDLVITHGPTGEYTRHQRHNEVSRAVCDLWCAGRLPARALWLFAYEDGERAYLPRAHPAAPVQAPLPDEIWQQKYSLVHDVYGFTPASWEARATPRTEAFWCFTSPEELRAWLG